MPRLKRKAPRAFEIVMDEAGDEAFPWDLDEHLKGCLASYQQTPSYGVAVFFALEAICGIVRDAGIRAKTGEIDPAGLDEDWILPPSQNVPVPWLWLRSLGTAWDKYKSEGGPLGHAFGLEGGGQGKPPAIATLTQMLDERAIARWIWSQVQQARAAQKKVRIEDLIQEAAEKFHRSDVTVRRAWRRFGQCERQRTSADHNFPK